MANVVVVGAQWGDEGKGKLVDLLAGFADVVVRFQGGPNAGHTLVVNGKKTVLHQVPSGVLHPGKPCLIGHGVVLDPEVLGREIDELKAAGLLADDAQLAIAEGAHVVLPYHRLLDAARERARGLDAIGTTGRGIGPCYEDKIARRGVRAGDLAHPDRVEKRVRARLPELNGQLGALGDPPVRAEDVLDWVARHAPRVVRHLADVPARLAAEVARGRSILFEGAQGTLLDVDHGTYPYVTASNTVAGAAAVGSGLPPGALQRVVGITKAYATRVGGGPFPTELDDDLGKLLRAKGEEFGATTGRPRRCGWLDAVVLRYAARLNGLTALALTKLDVLTGIDPVRICVAYEVDGRRLDTLPPGAEDLARVKPVYEDQPGWKEPLGDVRQLDDLPRNARRYVAAVEQLAGVPVQAVSVGADRSATLVLQNPFR